MARTPFPAEKLARIQSARPEETAEALAEELGVSVRTVKTYRTQSRKERAEVAREAVREVVESAAPDAIKTLRRTMVLSSEEMEKERSTAWLRETRESAIAVLKYLGLTPEKDPLDGVNDQELIEEALRRAGRLKGG
jgi:hypothetical protein